MLELGVLLRRHRLLAGLSQEALADRAGLSVRGISDLERGVRRMPYPNTIARLATALDLDDAARQALLLLATQPPAPAQDLTPQGSSDEVEPLAAIIAQAPAQERRWVTLLAVKLSGFAAVAQRLDPEDLQALATRCVERITTEVHRFDGTVLRADADSLLAVFGAPVAHEDDPQRAVRAAVAIGNCRLPQADEGLSQLQARIGVDTGEVLAGVDAERRYSVSGAVVSAAASLAGAHGRAVVLVGEQTYRATYQLVRFRAMPAVATPDWSRPQPAWEVLDIAPTPPARRLGNAPFVGRDDELGVLDGALSRVLRERRPQLISVLGEPGIGKSRLVLEFEQRALASADIRAVHGRCLPYGETVGYGALTAALFELASITPDDAADAARSRLRQLASTVLAPFAADPMVRDGERHLALLTGLASEADRRATPPDERTVHVSVRRFLEAAARLRPLCLFIEDLHWADEALLTLLEHVAERAVAAPLLIITQARPELLERRPTWGGGIRAFTSLALEPIDGAAGLTLAAALCRERGLPPNTAEHINRMAGGNPLFAEELCAAVAEGRDTGGVPSVLRALISARLDALPAGDKHALQHAAVLGKRVWPAGLAALDPGGDLFERLEALERRDLLRLQPASELGSEREYAFKHDLIQEVAYSQLPRAERRRLHARLVEWLEQASGERIEEILDLLAHHAINADLHQRALDYLSRAADRAGRAAAHREEAALLEQAIGLAAEHGPAELVPEFRARRGRALTRLTQWADAQRELEAALADLPADRTERRAEVLVDLALACNWNMNQVALRQRATEALQVANTVARMDLAMDARFWLAWATGSEGDVGSAIDQYRLTVAETDQLGIELAPSVLPLYSTALCWAGHFEPAVERARDAVRLARLAGDTDSTILALQILGLALAGTGAYDEALQTFDFARQFGRDYGIRRFLARATAMAAGFHLEVFDYDGHSALASEACELARAANFSASLISASIDLLLNAIRCGELGRAAELEAEVGSAIAGAPSWHGWLWALRFAQARAELALARGDRDGAITYSHSALVQARGRRPKYEVLALVTRATAHLRGGLHPAASNDLTDAVRIARSVGDPALFLHAATARLAVDGDDSLARDARAAAQHIMSRLPTTEMRHRFESAESVRLLERLAT